MWTYRLHAVYGKTGYVEHHITCFSHNLSLIAMLSVPELLRLLPIPTKQSPVFSFTTTAMARSSSVNLSSSDDFYMTDLSIFATTDVGCTVTPLHCNSSAMDRSLSACFVPIAPNLGTIIFFFGIRIQWAGTGTLLVNGHGIFFGHMNAFAYH